MKLIISGSRSRQSRPALSSSTSCALSLNPRQHGGDTATRLPTVNINNRNRHHTRGEQSQRSAGTFGGRAAGVKPNLLLFLPSCKEEIKLSVRAVVHLKRKCTYGSKTCKLVFLAPSGDSVS